MNTSADNPNRLAAEAAAWSLLIASAAFACALAVVAAPEFTRFAVAAVAGSALLLLWTIRPAAGLLATVCFVAVVALLRRLLIPAAGWTVHDPLLIVAPVVVSILAARQFVAERNPAPADLLSKLVTAVFAIVVLESLNPRNGSLAVGAGGLLFMGLPMLWFFSGRQLLGDGRTLERLLGCVVGLGVAIAAYGFYQSIFGLPSWDHAWSQIAGYGSLFLERDVTNTFGTFASTSEYTIFMGIAVAAAVGLGLHGRRAALLSLPVTLPAVFLSSNRTAFVFTLIAVATVLTLRCFRPRVVPAVLLVCVLVIAGLSPAIGAALRAGAGATGDARVEYQLSGLGDPLNRESSTLTLHWAIVSNGVRQGLADPFGRGSGVTNASVLRFGSGDQNEAVSSNTEVDISNAFVALGLVGGLAYLALVVTTFVFAFRNYFARRDAASLAVVGVLVAAFGNWLNGGHYAVTPVIWLLLGATTALSNSRSTYRSATAAVE
ncbi:MAG: hypothetical protein ACRDKI_06195 [Solirubrobacterales bacterium]